MIDRLPLEALPAIRNKFLNELDGRLPLHLGFYLQWFAIAEVHITTILACVLKLTQLEQLEYVIRGMDARVKCERLRQAAKVYRPLGDNLKISLGVFEQDCIPLRNRVAHSWAILDDKTDIIHFGSFGRMPKPNKDGPLDPHSGAHQIHIDDLFSQAMWINLFVGDLIAALDGAIAGGSLEIGDPKSRLPQGEILKTPQPDDPAKPDKPTQSLPETGEG